MEVERRLSEKDKGFNHRFCSLICSGEYKKHRHRRDIDTEYFDPGALDTAIAEYKTLARSIQQTCEMAHYKRFVAALDGSGNGYGYGYGTGTG
jgi:hypothetical protein